MFIGNPFTDVPDLQTYSFVVTDNDPDLAAREAIRIAESFWPNRHRMQVPLMSLDEMATRLQQPSRARLHSLMRPMRPVRGHQG